MSDEEIQAVRDEHATTEELLDVTNGDYTLKTTYRDEPRVRLMHEQRGILLDEVDRLLAQIRDLKAVRKVAESSYPCQVCDKTYPSAFLFDLKGYIPAGCKVTCLECVGRLEERERCARVAEKVGQSVEVGPGGDCAEGCRGISEKIAAAIRSAAPHGGDDGEHDSQTIPR